jgi:flagellin
MISPIDGLTMEMANAMGALPLREGVTIKLDAADLVTINGIAPGSTLTVGRVITLSATEAAALNTAGRKFKEGDIIRSLNQDEADVLNQVDKRYFEGTDITTKAFMEKLVSALTVAYSETSATLFPTPYLNVLRIADYIQLRPPTDFGRPFDASNLMGQTMDYFGNNLWVASSYTTFTDYNGGAHRVCIGEEIYYIGNSEMGTVTNDIYKYAISLSAALYEKGNPLGNPLGKNPPDRPWETIAAISALAYAINNNPDSKFWARIETHIYKPGYQSLYVFSKESGEKSDVKGCDEQMGNIRGDWGQYSRIVWYNDEIETLTSAGTYFNNGGKHWGTLQAVPTGYGSWGVRLLGQDVGKERDLWILNVGAQATADINTAQNVGYTGKGFGYVGGESITNLLGLDRQSFVEIQNADDGAWAGAHIRTQSDAQEALDAIQAAIERKDKIRASLGAFINRLENTITNLEIQVENLQAAESRISDVDMATEMTEFVRNQILTQAAVSMLSQANSLPQMALSLLNG